MDKKRFLELLHSYELGIAISDEEVRELELFLIENDEYLDEVKQFQPVINNILDNSEIRDTIAELAISGNDRSSEIHHTKSGIKKIFARFGPVLAVFLIALFFVIKPWKIEISSTDEAHAFENRLAIMFFINIGDRSDSSGTAEVIRNLLVADLSESDYFRVVSQQRIQDVKNSLHLDDEQVMDQNTIYRIANEISAEWTLTGSILESPSQIIITGELAEVSSGNIIGSQKIVGKPGDNIFSLADKLSKLIKDDLPLPERAVDEYDRQVSEITSKSPKAYQLYLKGVENYNRFYNEEASSYFWSALQLDSTLAMAYYYMSIINFGNTSREFINKAMQYSENAGRTDRQLIKSQMASVSGDYKQAIDELVPLLDIYPDDKNIYYRIAVFYRQLDKLDSAVFYDREALKIDPNFGEVINHLSYMYKDLGENKKSIQLIDKYIALNPKDANPYDSKGELYVRMGEIELAKKYFIEAIKIKPDFGPSIRSLARLYLTEGEFVKAENCFEKLSLLHRFMMQRKGRLGKATIFQFRGQFQKSLEELDMVIAKKYDDSIITWNPAINAFAYLMKSKVLAELGDYSGALESYENYSNMFLSSVPNESLMLTYYPPYLLQASGDSVGADKLLGTYKKVSLKNEVNMRGFLLGSGLVNFERGNYEKAIDYIIKDIEMEDRFYSNYMLGRCYIELGQFDKAIKILENWKKVYFIWHQFSDIWDVKLQYYLGVAYEGSGDYKNAIAHYEKFLDFWKEADSNIPALNDGRERLKRLRQIK